jgi:hypothetical protein
MARKSKNKTEVGNRFNIGMIAKYSETTSSADRATALKWFASQGEDTQAEVLQKHGALLHEKRTPGIPITAELSLGMLVLASKIFQREEMALQAKQRLDLSKSADVSRRRMNSLKIERRTKTAPKYEKIRIEYYPVITELIAAGNSWNMVSAYLSKFYRFPVTTAYLYNSYQKIKKNLEVANV